MKNEAISFSDGRKTRLTHPIRLSCIETVLRIWFGYQEGEDTGVGLMVVGLGLTLLYFVVVGFIVLICLIIFWPLGIIVGVCWLAATAWLLTWSFRSHDGKRSNRFVTNTQTKNVTLDELNRRAPRVANEAASMIQTSKWLLDNGKPAEAMKLASDSKRALVEFGNEFDEAEAQLTRRGWKIRGVDNAMASLEKMRRDIDLFENALREKIVKAR